LDFYFAPAWVDAYCHLGHVLRSPPENSQLIAKAGKRLPLSKARQAPEKILGSGHDLSALFGLDIVENPVSKREPVRKSPLQVSHFVPGRSNETPAQRARNKPSSSRLKNDEQTIQE
jgi:hypothetical protein